MDPADTMGGECPEVDYVEVLLGAIRAGTPAAGTRP
jgi:hypothetical protein